MTYLSDKSSVFCLSSLRRGAGLLLTLVCMLGTATTPQTTPSLSDTTLWLVEKTSSQKLPRSLGTVHLRDDPEKNNYNTTLTGSIRAVSLSIDGCKVTLSQTIETGWEAEHDIDDAQWRSWSKKDTLGTSVYVFSLKDLMPSRITAVAIESFPEALESYAWFGEPDNSTHRTGCGSQCANPEVLGTSSWAERHSIQTSGTSTSIQSNRAKCDGCTGTQVNDFQGQGKVTRIGVRVDSLDLAQQWSALGMMAQLPVGQGCNPDLY